MTTCTFCQRPDHAIVAKSGPEKLCRCCLDDAVNAFRRLLEHRRHKRERRQQRLREAVIANLEVVP